MTLVLRDSHTGDIPGITNIYGHAVQTGLTASNTTRRMPPRWRVAARG